MHDQEFAIVKSLVSVAWADGTFEKAESEMLDGLLDAYGATDVERSSLRDYAKEQRGLEDIPIQDLSADDRRILLQHAVLLSFADGDQAPAEAQFLRDLAARLNLPSDESTALLKDAEARARRHLSDLGA